MISELDVWLNYGGGGNYKAMQICLKMRVFVLGGHGIMTIYHEVGLKQALIADVPINLYTDGQYKYSDTMFYSIY